MKAMILAAGLGKRLKPITDTTPKPLVEAGGKALIEYTILRLKNAGIQDIVLNVCPHKEKIKAYLQDGEKWGVRLHYSDEATPLETGGGIVKALPLLGPDPFLLVSGDIYVEYDFSQLKSKLSNNNLIHLVMVPNPHFKPQGDYELNEGCLVIAPTSRYNYGGFGVLHPDLFKTSQIEAFPVASLFKKAILDEQATGEVFTGTWHNIGTIDDLNTLKAALNNG